MVLFIAQDCWSAWRSHTFTGFPNDTHSYTLKWNQQVDWKRSKAIAECHDQGMELFGTSPIDNASYAAMTQFKK